MNRMQQARRMCPFSRVYDAAHIKQYGYGCHYRHSAYRWPPVMRNRFTLVSDSICKYVKKTRETFVQAEPGTTISGLYWKIKMHTIKVTHFEMVLLHVGTNDLEKETSSIISDYKNLIRAVRRNNSTCLIVVSAVLPRPKDSESMDSKRTSVNASLRMLCREMDCQFIRTWRPFVDPSTKQVKRELYARDGLHLSAAGTDTLARFLDGSVLRLKGNLKPN